MPWVYIDDHFDEHPKFEAAGPEAIGLYLAGLCFANRNLTGGRIPKAKAHRLVSGNCVRLASRLIGVRLWEDHGNEYAIHDYEPMNATAQAKAKARSERARKAAEARWEQEKADARGNAPRNADSNAQAMPGAMLGASAEQCSSNAEPMPYAGARAGSPHPLPPLTSQPLEPIGGAAAGEGGQEDLEAVAKSVWEHDWSWHSSPEDMSERATKLGTRMLSVVKANGGRASPRQAASLACWATTSMDYFWLDRLVGEVSQQAAPPRSCAYFATTIRNRAKSEGVEMPEWQAPNGRAP